MKEEIIEVEIGKIKPNPFLARKYDKDEVRKMAETIKTQGLINLPEVDENITNITGGQRIEAVKLLGWKKMKVKKITGLSEVEKISRSFIENKHRRDMTYSEEIEIIKTLLNFFNHLKKKRGQVGWQSRVAKMLGVSETWLSQLLTFDEQTPIEIKNLVKSGRLSINKAMDIMKLPERMREIKISDLMEEAKIKKRCKNPKDSIERIKIWIESGKELFKADMSLKSCEEIRDQFNDVIMPFYNHICQRLKNKTWR